MNKNSSHHSDPKIFRNGILLPKLFWPMWEKIVLVIEKNFWNSWLKTENLQKIWDHLNNLFKQWEVRTIFGNRMFFLTCSWMFLRYLNYYFSYNVCACFRLSVCLSAKKIFNGNGSSSQIRWTDISNSRIQARMSWFLVINNCFSDLSQN